ncbi:hypothetical protein BD410DRAFT_893837 [Rickenella mellea]|uniref:Uncharacterized protein n=1 Tax=Rickenella mellea TaxID=50990 RepID=A0A4Y7QPN2_9AGAM|nr:hypothetical protein BD410DRAFT_893837 [Rickenella mellea]
MPPKPRPASKPQAPSTAQSQPINVDQQPVTKAPAEAMPPPPVPVAILEPEIDALAECLRHSVVKTAQILKYYADTKRLGIHRHVPDPPRALTASLAHEIGKYDQLCDTMESHLLRAISVLQRDLAREQERLREEERQAAAAKQAAAVAGDIEMSQAASVQGEQRREGSQTVSPSRTLPLNQLRRQSKISLSTLHRSPFPLKLDLSSSALRLGLEEAGMGMSGITGLASPVTLAPKSARPMAAAHEIPPELLAAFAASANEANQGVDMDLSIGDSSMDHAQISGEQQLGTAQKPIELDLDMDVNMSDLDLFGDPQGNNVTGGEGGVDGLFTPPNHTIPEGASSSAADNNMNSVLLDAFSGARGSQDTTDIFAGFKLDNTPPSIGTSSQPPLMLSDSNLGPKETPAAAPSPSSILASLGSIPQGVDPHLTQDGQPGGGLLPDASTSFDFRTLEMPDMSNFNPDFFGTHGSDDDLMNQILNMDNNAGEAGRPGEASGAGEPSQTTHPDNANITS